MPASTTKISQPNIIDENDKPNARMSAEKIIGKIPIPEDTIWTQAATTDWKSGKCQIVDQTDVMAISAPMSAIVIAMINQLQV
mmetsp:Transcript_65473/g.164979  ORF Transcript_65473/g.164979 Transcript_65473/m.164979 type:complete len:83 (-) Transcript_65473:10-258(-)